MGKHGVEKTWRKCICDRLLGLQGHITHRFSTLTTPTAYHCQLLDQLNFRLHTAAVNSIKIGTNAVEHPSYSQDLQRCDFHLFGPLKEALGGNHFENDEQNRLCNWVLTRPASFYHGEIKKTFYSVGKMCFKKGILCRKIFFFNFLHKNFFEKKNSNLYLISPRNINDRGLV